MGFRADEASAALRSSNGNVQQAIDALLNRRSVPTGRGTARQSSYESRDGDRGAGRGRRERKDDDDGMYSKTFQCKIVNIFLPINFNICFGCSKGLSLRRFF